MRRRCDRMEAHPSAATRRIQSNLERPATSVVDAGHARPKRTVRLHLGPRLDGRQNPARFCGMVNVVKLTLQRMETNVMKRFLQIALAMMTLGLTGYDEGKYPVNGEACGPDDPVQKLDANDCAVLPGV